MKDLGMYKNYLATLRYKSFSVEHFQTRAPQLPLLLTFPCPRNYLDPHVFARMPRYVHPLSHTTHFAYRSVPPIPCVHIGESTTQQQKQKESYTSSQRNKPRYPITVKLSSRAHTSLFPQTLFSLPELRRLCPPNLLLDLVRKHRTPCPLTNQSLSFAPKPNKGFFSALVADLSCSSSLSSCITHTATRIHKSCKYAIISL